MGAPYPSLSSAGFISETYKKADRIMSTFFTSEFSQSNFYRGKISSLQYLVKSHGKEPNVLALKVQEMLTALFNRYFNDTLRESVTITVTSKDVDDSTDNRYKLNVDAVLVVDSIPYSLGRILDVENSLIKNIFEINNTGN